MGRPKGRPKKSQFPKICLLYKILKKESFTVADITPEVEEQWGFKINSFGSYVSTGLFDGLIRKNGLKRGKSPRPFVVYKFSKKVIDAVKTGKEDFIPEEKAQKNDLKSRIRQFKRICLLYKSLGKDHFILSDVTPEMLVPLELQKSTFDGYVNRGYFSEFICKDGVKPSTNITPFTIWKFSQEVIDSVNSGKDDFIPEEKSQKSDLPKIKHVKKEKTEVVTSKSRMRQFKRICLLYKILGNERFIHKRIQRGLPRCGITHRI